MIKLFGKSPFMADVLKIAPSVKPMATKNLVKPVFTKSELYWFTHRLRWM